MGTVPTTALLSSKNDDGKTLECLKDVAEQSLQSQI